MWRIAASVVLLGSLGAWASADSGLAGLETALSSGKIEEVRAAEQRLLSGNISIDGLLNAGALLAQHDMLADAATVFEKCSERFPLSFEAKYNLALARIGMNDYDAATRTLTTISPGSVRESAAIEYAHGKIYWATGSPREARQSFEKAFHANPGQENYALDLALVYISSAEYLPAIRILEAARSQHADSEALVLELAISRALAGQEAEAISVCRELLRQDPSRSTPRVITAFAYCLGGDYQACETEASAGLTYAHSSPYLHYLRAEAMWNASSNDKPKMLSELIVAVAAMPSCTVCLMLRSKVHEATGDEGSAIADLKAALKQDAHLAPAWYLLSVHYRKAGLSAEASDAIRHYRALRETQTNEEIEGFRKQFVGNLKGQADQ